MEAPPIDEMPGFRRRFKVTPAARWVRSEVEDDYHHMSVTIRHDGRLATSIEPVMLRAPWTTCPGAVAQLASTFTGVALDAFAGRGEKQANCTHLHDLALLAAAHACDREPLLFDILVSDPVDGKRRAELRRNGLSILSWTETRFRIVEPAELAGITLDKMRPWIDSLEPQRQEAVRLLRWGNMIANGRTIPLEKQSDASRMPSGSCYTFQPHRAVDARRVGVIRDFSNGTAQLLDEGTAVP
jgi:hypothetical protein